jgi:hypothetical protein
MAVLHNTFTTVLLTPGLFMWTSRLYLHSPLSQRSCTMSESEFVLSAPCLLWKRDFSQYALRAQCRHPPLARLRLRPWIPRRPHADRPAPPGDRSLQSPEAAPLRSPRVSSCSASLDGDTLVSSLLTSERQQLSLQGFASTDAPKTLGQAVVYELRARGGLSSDPPLLHWVPSSDPLTVCDRWRAHNYSSVGEIIQL